MKYLVIHTDTTGELDLAEVTADTALEAISEVEGYDDTLQVEFAIEFTGDVAPKVFGEDGHEIIASEGDALEDEPVGPDVGAESDDGAE